MMAMAYGNVYVAKVAIGAKDAQTVKAFAEAESYPGTSIILAYSHCIAHGFDLINGPAQQKGAVESGHWPLFRWDPRRLAEGQIPLVMDSAPPTMKIADYARNETRYRMVERANPERFANLMAQAQRETTNRFSVYQQLAAMHLPEGAKAGEPDPEA